jgi:hypothetical protein
MAYQHALFGMTLDNNILALGQQVTITAGGA